MPYEIDAPQCSRLGVRLAFLNVPVAALFLVVALVLIASPDRPATATPAPIENINTFLNQCPTNDPMYSQFRSDFEIRREGVIVGDVPCSEPISAMPIAQYTDELIALQTLRITYYMEGGRTVPYPWTTGSFYDWMKSKIGGIDIRNSGSYCCETYGGAAFISVVAQNEWDRDDAREWRGLSGRIAIFGHETRHVDGFPHAGGCPMFPSVGFGCDLTYDETNLSPYGIGWWLHEAWLSGDLAVGYACLSPIERTQIANWHIDRANNDFQGRFVTGAPPTLTMPAQPGGSCASASPTPTPSTSLAPSPTVVTTQSPAPTPSPTPSPSASPTPAPTATASPGPSPTPTFASPPPPTSSPSATPTVTPLPSAAPTASQTTTPTPSPTLSPSATVAPSDSPTPSSTSPLPPPASTSTPMASAVTSPAATPTVAPPARALPPEADANCDGDIDQGDGLEILRVLAGVEVHASGCLSPDGGTTPGNERGDANCDGDVDALDALEVVRYVAGLLSLLPNSCD